MPGSPSLAPASQFRQPKVTQASSTGPQGHCWLLPTEEGWAGLSTTTHAGPLAALPPEPHFCGLTLEYGLYALLAFLFVSQAFGRTHPPGSSLGSPSHPARPHQRVSWPQRKTGKKGRTLGRPRSMGVFLLAQQRSSSARLPGCLCAAVALLAGREKLDPAEGLSHCGEPGRSSGCHRSSAQAKLVGGTGLGQGSEGWACSLQGEYTCCPVPSG